jgi:hypothetical protein
LVGKVVLRLTYTQSGICAYGNGRKGRPGTGHNLNRGKAAWDQRKKSPEKEARD